MVRLVALHKIKHPLRALITGADAMQHDSGIYASSLDLGQGGNAGNVTFSAGSLTLQDVGRVEFLHLWRGQWRHGERQRRQSESLRRGPDRGHHFWLGGRRCDCRFGSARRRHHARRRDLKAEDRNHRRFLFFDARQRRHWRGCACHRRRHPTPAWRQISANSETAGTGGNVTVSARGDILLQQSSTISVRATVADAGSIYLNTPAEIQLFTASQITANAFKSGGQIYFGYNPPTVSPAVASRAAVIRAGIPIGLIILNDGNIVANAATLNGGRIQINADALLQSTGSLIDAATPNRKAIQGVVLETNPSQDLSGQLAVLPNAACYRSKRRSRICCPTPRRQFQQLHRHRPGRTAA